MVTLLLVWKLNFRVHNFYLDNLKFYHVLICLFQGLGWWNACCLTDVSIFAVFPMVTTPLWALPCGGYFRVLDVWSGIHLIWKHIYLCSILVKSSVGDAISDTDIPWLSMKLIEDYQSYRVLFVIKISEIVETNLHHSSNVKFANFKKSAIIVESGRETSNMIYCSRMN